MTTFGSPLGIEDQQGLGGGLGSSAYGGGHRSIEVAGSGTQESSQLCFIDGAPNIVILEGNTGAFVMNAVALEADPQAAHIYGYEPASVEALSFLTSHDNLAGTTALFIHAGVIEAEGLHSYIRAPFTQDVDPLRSFMYGAPTLNSFIEGTNAILATKKGGIYFNPAQSQYGQFYDNIHIRPTGEMTMNFWMKGYDAFSSGNVGAFIEKDYGTGQTIGIYEKSVAGSRGWHYGIATNGVWSAQNTVGSWIADKWYMCTLRYDGANVAFFVDGVKDSQFAKTGDISWTTDSWHIAHRPNTGQYTKMAFADFDLWNFALTDAEIAGLFHHPISQNLQECFIGGTEFDVLEEGAVSAFISSDLSAYNPALFDAPTQMCAIAFAAEVVTQKCYLVGGDILDGTHDLQIIIDNFGVSRHDLAIRIGGQGERVRRTQLGDVTYPVTRESYRDLPNLFYKDMPGKLNELQRCFINSGFIWNSVDGNVSGVENGPDPLPRPLYIVVKSPTWNYQMCYLHGRFNDMQASVGAFISNSNHTATQGAYVVCAELEKYYTNTGAYVHGTTVPDIAAPAQGAYIAGQDAQTSDIQWGHISTALTAFGFVSAYVTTTAVTEIQTTQDQDMNIYMFASALAFDDGQMCYMLGTNLIDTHLTIEENNLNPFIHAQPIAEVSVSCYIGSPWPWVHFEPALIFVYGNQPQTVVQNLFLQASLNVEEDQWLYLTSHMPMESARRAYIRGSNETVPNLNASRQTAFINCETPIEDTTSCYIVSAAVYGDALATDMRAFIMNSDPVAPTSSTLCFIPSVEAGDAVTTEMSGFIVNSDPVEIVGTTRCFIASGTVKTGQTLGDTTPTFIMNRDNLAAITGAKRCFIRVGSDPTIFVPQTCYIFGSYTVKDSEKNIVGGFIEGHV